MALKTNSQISFAAPYVEKRKTRRKFLPQIQKIIDWEAIEQLLTHYYAVGQSDRGRKAYPPLLLFKIALLQTWYGLSDYEIEDQVKDSLSFTTFCGLQLEDDVPDHSVISRFRKALSKKKDAWDHLLRIVNEQLEDRGVLVKQGAIVDASITESPRKPKGKKVYQMPTNPEEPLQEQAKPGVDTEGSWLKKGGKLQYGYKRHYVCDQAEGLVLGVSTTPASAHESQHMASVLNKTTLPPGSPVLADKGYCSSSNAALLKTKGLKNRIQKKAYRNKPLSPWAGRYNKLISKDRYKIERVFGSIKRWFGRLSARYVGMAKTHGQHVLEALCYNLYRTPGLIMSKSLS